MNEIVTQPMKKRLLYVNSSILLADIVLFIVMLNTLPFEKNIVIGLSILTFVAILPISVFVLYILLKPNLSHTFSVNTKKLEWDRKKSITIAIFFLTVLCWVFSKPINAILGGFDKFDTLVTLSAVVALIITKVIEWKDIDKSTDWGIPSFYNKESYNKESYNKEGYTKEWIIKWALLPIYIRFSVTTSNLYFG